MTDLTSRQRGRPQMTGQWLPKKISLVKSPRLGSTPRHTDWLTVSCKVTLTLWLWLDRLCGLVVRVPGYTTEKLFLLWDTNWIYIYYVEESRPPLWSSGQSSWLHNGEVLCLLWGTNWIHICYVEESRPPLWSSGRIFWLQNGNILCFLWGVGLGALLAADSQLTSKSGYRASLGTFDQILACSSLGLTVTLFCFQCVFSDEKTGL
jgi:hypothetical protein